MLSYEELDDLKKRRLRWLLERIMRLDKRTIDDLTPSQTNKYEEIMMNETDPDFIRSISRKKKPSKIKTKTIKKCSCTKRK